jgi:hypothetical protein
VFGNWFGDFVTPGSQKDNAPVANSGVGGATNQTINPVSSSYNSTNSNSNSSANNQVVSGPTNVQSRVSSLTQTQLPQARVSSNTLAFSDSSSEVLASSDLNESVSSNTAKQVNLNLAWLLPVFGVGVLLALARARFRAK